MEAERERVAFEKWMSDRWAWTGPIADVAWITWQARASIEIQEAAPPEQEPLTDLVVERLLDEACETDDGHPVHVTFARLIQRALSHPSPLPEGERK